MSQANSNDARIIEIRFLRIISVFTPYLEAQNPMPWSWGKWRWR